MSSHVCITGPGADPGFCNGGGGGGGALPTGRGLDVC